MGGFYNTLYLARGREPSIPGLVVVCGHTEEAHLAVLLKLPHPSQPVAA
jgi:hypothetical protein